MSRHRTLGEVLVRMGFVRQQDLDRLYADLTQATKEEKWGNQLIAHGIVTRKQLDQALQLFHDLNEEDPEKRGTAACALADRESATVINLADRVATKAATIHVTAAERRRETGPEYPAVKASSGQSDE